VDVRAALRAQGLQFTTREQWGATHNYAARPAVTIPTRYLFWHIAVIADPNDLVGTERERMRALERIGNQRFKSGISYGWAVFDTGRQYEGARLDRKGTHTVNDKELAGYPSNLNYYGISCVLPQVEADEVTDAQLDGTARFGAATRRARLTTATEWYPHQKFANKACPGRRAMARLAELNKLTDHYTRVGLRAAAEEEDDMFEAADRAKLDYVSRQCKSLAELVILLDDRREAQIKALGTAVDANVDAETAQIDAQLAEVRARLEEVEPNPPA
jgi:hypothetical protein